MERKLVAKVNGEIMTGSNYEVLEVLADRYLSVQEFMYAVGYDINDEDDLEKGYNNSIDGFYIDDNGDYCFDFENCEIVKKED